MNRILYSARAIVLGLLTTQVLATCHVYLSNSDLYRTVTAITQAGYLAIPNQQVVYSLREFGPAFFGGWFFTLSLGAGLSILCVACAWIWDRIFGRNSAILIPIIILWLGIVVAVNGQGFCPMVTAYFVAIPLVVFGSTVKWMPQQEEKNVWTNRLVHILPIVLLTIIWTAHASRSLFLDIRDYLLLSNPVGKKVDDFYYRYTLYPAQVFKTLEQKTLKTSCLSQVKDKTVARRIENVLINYDYLPVAAKGPVDLVVMESGSTLDFNHKGKTVLQTTLKKFLSDPKQILGRFSAETDRYALFRQATIVCLLLGFPILLYVMVFTLIHFASGFFVSSTRSSVVAASLCFLIGLALLAPFRIGGSRTVDAVAEAKALESEHWQQRVIALRTMVSEGLEIGKFQAYRRMLASPHLPERYWLAKALGLSCNPETYRDLLTFLDDPHPNVVSMAFYALGQRGERQAVKEILKRIETSDHWYNQWYAYRALKRLGWRQTRGRNGGRP
jgi:hypothetical protein